jgi:O-antigen/teichoic acid export membrane protein
MSSNFNLRRFAKDSAYNLTRQALSILLGLITSIIIARTLGVEARGVYAVTLLLSTILITLINSGFQVSIIYHAARAEHEITSMIQDNNALTVWLALGGLGIGAVVILFLHDYLFSDVPQTLLLFSLFILPVTMFKENLNSIFRGNQDFRTFNLIEIIPQIGILVLTILLVAWLQIGVIGAILAIIGGRLMGLVIAAWTLHKRYQTNLMSLRINWPYTRQIVQYGKYVHIANISALLNYRIDTLLLNLLSTTRSVGIYDVAVTLVERLWSLSEALSAIMLPRIASLSNDDPQRRHLTPIVARYLFWINVTIGIVLSILAEWLIVLLYGEPYRESAVALRLLIPGIVIWGVATILAQDVSGRGEPRLNAAAATIAALVNFVGNMLLIPHLDYAGASITTTISYTMYALILAWSFSHLSGASWRELIVPTREDVRRLRLVLKWGLNRLSRKPG